MNAAVKYVAGVLVGGGLALAGSTPILDAVDRAVEVKHAGQEGDRVSISPEGRSRRRAGCLAAGAACMALSGYLGARYYVRQKNSGNPQE